jgi:hypothetical protein
MKRSSSDSPPISCLQPGYFLSWRGHQYRVLSGEPDDTLLLQLEEVTTGAREAVRVEALFTVAEDEKDIPVFAPTLSALQKELEHRFPPPKPTHAVSLPTHLLQQATHIITVVEAVEQAIAAAEARAHLQNEPFRRTPALRQACAQLADPVHPSTYYRYRQLYLKYGGDRGQIASALRRSTFNQSRMEKAQLHFVDTLIMRFYARSQALRLRPLTVYRIARSTLQRTHGLWVDPARCHGAVPENLVEELLNPDLPLQAIVDNPEKKELLKPITLPSRGWFYQYLRWFEHQPDLGKAVITTRYGKETWEREHLVFDTFAARASLPLQYVFADHWLLHVFTVDEATRSRLDRLWLTLLLDAYSRGVLGMTLAYEVPCVETVQSALRHAIWPKISHQELDIEGEWVCYGIPQQLFLDNAWAHHAYSVQNLARAIGQGGRYSTIDLVYRPPYKGRYGALVERFFGNLSGQVKELLPGALRAGDRRSLRQAGQEACLLYQDIYRIIHQLILVYQHTPHHELGGLTPHEKWVEGMAWGAPLVPVLTPSVERLFWRMSPKPRVITAKGVCAFGLHYWSPALSTMERVGLDGRPTPYHFSYEPADISRLALFQDGQWMGDVYAKELRLADGSTRSFSFWEQKMAQTLAREDGQRVRDWLAYIHEIDALSRQRLAEKKQHQRLQARGATGSTRRPADTASEVAAVLEGKMATPDYTDLLTDFLTDGQEGIR